MYNLSMDFKDGIEEFVNWITLNEVKEALVRLKNRGQFKINTIEIIRECQGSYQNCITTKWGMSNDDFGRFISKNQSRLGLEKGEEISVVNDNGEETTAREWDIL